MSKEKLGRNDPCWCGSGKKYKKCHENRSDETPYPYYEMASSLMNLRGGERKCLHPSSGVPCTGVVIKAHSISRSAALSKIARDGRVYQPDSNPFQIEKRAGTIKHRLTGIGAATTFTGFCSTHDAQLFKPIDEGSLIPTKEQLFLMHYRALCRELYVKRPSIETNQLLRNADRGRPQPWQHFVQRLVDGRDEALRVAVRELESDKAGCDKAIASRDYKDFVGCALLFAKIPTLACAGLSQPVYDFSGKMLQNLLNLDQPAFSLSFTLLPADSGGILAFGWPASGDHVCRQFVNSLLSVPADRMSDAVVQLIFDCCENHVAQPDWWESLPEEIHTDLERRLLNWTDMSPVNQHALVLGPHKYADWKFRSATWM